MNYNQPHKFYCGVDPHARSMFTHVLDNKGKTMPTLREDRQADSDEIELTNLNALMEET